MLKKRSRSCRFHRLHHAASVFKRIHHRHSRIHELALIAGGQQGFLRPRRFLQSTCRAGRPVCPVLCVWLPVVRTAGPTMVRPWQRARRRSVSFTESSRFRTSNCAIAEARLSCSEAGGAIPLLGRMRCDGGIHCHQATFVDFQPATSGLIRSISSASSALGASVS